MALSADAQALLELLLARGQSYADIGSLLELPEAEVRARARAALTELGGADPDRRVPMTDWLLGQADPIGRADAARHVREDAEDHRLAASLVGALRELAPEADLPRLPGEPSGRFRRRAAPPDADAPPPVPKPAKPPRERRRLTALPAHQTRLLFALGGAALLLIVVVLAVAGVFDGGSEAGETTAATTTGDDEGTQADVPADGDTATIPLRPVGGGDASGTVTIGLTTGDQGFVDLEAENLQPPPNGSTYYIWFMQDEISGYPYQRLIVEGSSATSQRFVLPNEALGVVLAARSIDVWISPVSELEKRIPQALQDSTVVEVPGERVLSAPVRRAIQAAQGGG